VTIVIALPRVEAKDRACLEEYPVEADRQVIAALPPPREKGLPSWAERSSGRGARRYWMPCERLACR